MIFSHGIPHGLSGAPCAAWQNAPMELRIEELRAAKGVSQTEMARELGVEQPTVSKWISGKNSPPTKNLQAIADYFGVEPILLFKRYARSAEHIEIVLQLLNLTPKELKAVKALVSSLATALHEDP